jgi:TldD protein
MNEDFAKLALATVQKLGASYADVRYVAVETENLQVKKGVPEEIRKGVSAGIGIRAIAKGAWGFAGTTVLKRASAVDTAKKAFKVALASARAKKTDVKLSPNPPKKAKYFTPFQKDPFKISLEEKIETMKTAERTAAAESTELIKTSSSFFRAHKERKLFLNSEGAKIDQTILWCGGGVSATAIRSGDVQIRSYPASFRGSFNTAGYEFFESLDLAGHAREVAREAIQLLSAEKCPSTTTTLLIAGDQLALQVHESSGHPTELDRAMGTEADYAGTSFLTTDKLGTFRYGSPKVNISADATAPGGLGTYAYDDEGVPAKNVPLIREGLFVNYQSSRETAALLNLPEGSSGGMRADSPLATPIVRMSNINLLPGDWKVDELIRDTQDGILMLTNKSWSIDDRRLNFLFGTEAAWLIRNGSKERMIKQATYTGITHQFWGSCDAVSSDDWRMHGTPTCGKGVPSQVMYVGHGVSTARFRNVRIGIA